MAPQVENQRSIGHATTALRKAAKETRTAAGEKVYRVHKRAIGFLEAVNYQGKGTHHAARFNVSGGMAIDALWTFQVEPRAGLIMEKAIEWRGNVIRRCKNREFTFIGKKGKRVVCDVHEVCFAPVAKLEPNARTHFVVILDSLRYYDIQTKTCISYWTAGRVFFDTGFAGTTTTIDEHVEPEAPVVVDVAMVEEDEESDTSSEEDEPTVEDIAQFMLSMGRSREVTPMQPQVVKRLRYMQAA